MLNPICINDFRDLGSENSGVFKCLLNHRFGPTWALEEPRPSDLVIAIKKQKPDFVTPSWQVIHGEVAAVPWGEEHRYPAVRANAAKDIEPYRIVGRPRARVHTDVLARKAGCAGHDPIDIEGDEFSPPGSERFDRGGFSGARGTGDHKKGLTF